MINFRFFIALMFLFFAINAESAETPVELASDDGRPIEAVMGNTSNQFIYSFFGKDLLLYYLTNKDEIDAVSEASDTDLASLSKPFNSVTGKLFMAGLTLLYLLCLGYFIYRSFSLLAHFGWVAQTHGDFKLDQREKIGLSVKVVLLGSLVVIPIPLKSDLVDNTFYTNLGTIVLFDLMGRFHERSDEALVSVIDSQRQSLKTLAMPAADSKMKDMQALNSFYTCTRLQYGRSNRGEYESTFDLFIKDGDTLSGATKIGDCLLRVNLGIDTKSDLKISQIKKSTNGFSMNDTLFADAQKSTFKSLLEEIFSNSKRYSEQLSKESVSTSWDDGPFSFKSQTSLELEVPELKKWPEKCESNDLWVSPNGSKISKRDRFYFHHLTSRCQSKIVAQKLVYPDSYEAMSNYIGNGDRTQKEIALCVDSSSMNKVLGESRFVAQYGIGSTDPGNIEKIALDSCVVNMCSASSLNEGGMYACANALDLFQTRLRDVKMQERGIMMLGFYMFDLFLHHPPSSSAKHVFNKFSITFEPGGSLGKEDLQEGIPFMSFDYEIPASSQHVVQKDQIVGSLLRGFSRLTLPTIYEPLVNNNFVTELMGTDRLSSCVKNPLQIHGGYVCGNLPQEFSRFGLTLMKNVVTVKTLLTVGQSIGRMRRANVGDSGILTKGAQKEVDSAVRLMSITALNFISNDNEYFGKMFDNIVGFHYNVTDEFGYLNSSRVDQLMNNSLMTTIVFLSAYGESSSLISLIDSLLVFGIVISIVFAFAIPLFPMLIVLGAFIKYFYLLNTTIIMSGFKLVDAALDRDADFLSEELDRIFADWMALCLKFPLTLVGAFLAWLMSNVIISHVLSHIDLNVSTNDGAQGVFDMVVILIVSFSIVFIVYNMIMTLIESFYDFTIEWVLGTMHSSPYSENTKAIGWKNSKEVLHLLGR